MSKRFALLAAIALVLVPAAALAGETNPPATVASGIKIRASFPAFHGRVVAENGSCNGPRPVKLFERKRNGDKRLYGRTSSDIDGHWQVIVDPLASGAYFAVAPRFRRNDGGFIFICERAKSRTLVVD